MANILTPNFNYTWNGKEDNDLLIKPIVSHKSVLEEFTVYNGVPSKFQIPMASALSGITRARSGCGRSEAGSGVNITNKTLTTAEMGAFMSECASVFEGTVYSLDLKSGTERNDLLGTPIERLMRELYLPALQSDAYEIANFGDVSLTSNDNLKMMDGKWTKAIAGVASYDIEKLYDLPDTLVAGDGIKALKALYEGASPLLRQVPIEKRVFEVTSSVYFDIMSSLESSSSTFGDLYLERLVNGVSVLKYRGVTVEEKIKWGEIIATHTLGNPNRIMYTTKDNHILGVENGKDVTKIDMWYSKDHDIVYVDTKYRMGYEYKWGELIAVAY